ncbi:MAG: hypothetical protein ACPGSB_00300 [Opitutales bacterium]
MKTRRCHKSRWIRKKEAVLTKIMREIHKRCTGEKRQTIGKACRIIAKRYANKPADLGKERPPYSPSATTLQRQYSRWKLGPEFSTLSPNYKSGTSKVTVQFIIYLTEKLLNAESNVQAYNEIEEEWAAGFRIPGLGSLHPVLMPHQARSFPLHLASATTHHLTAEERQEIHEIRRMRRELQRRVVKLQGNLKQRLENRF